MAEDNFSNLFNNFKNMLNTNNSSVSEDTDSSSNNNFNITPEMINNLANVLQNQSSNTKKDSNTESPTISSESDSSAFKDLNSNNSTFKNFNPNNLDFENILRIKSIIDTLNKEDDPRSNLLYSLKPYLRENKKKKLDQYVNLFKITKVTNLFRNENGDK